VISYTHGDVQRTSLAVRILSKLILEQREYRSLEKVA